MIASSVFSWIVAIKIAVFVAINVSVAVLDPADVLFNDTLGDLGFKLTRLVLKT